LLRLFQTSGMLHYEITPVPATSFEDLDNNKLKDYFYDYRKINISEIEQFVFCSFCMMQDMCGEVGQGDTHGGR